MGLIHREAPGLHAVQANESDDPPICMDPNDRGRPNVSRLLSHGPIRLQARVVDHHRIAGLDQEPPEFREQGTGRRSLNPDILSLS